MALEGREGGLVSGGYRWLPIPGSVGQGKRRIDTYRSHGVDTFNVIVRPAGCQLVGVLLLLEHERQTQVCPTMAHGTMYPRVATNVAQHISGDSVVPQCQRLVLLDGQPHRLRLKHHLKSVEGSVPTHRGSLWKLQILHRFLFLPW